MSKNQTGFTLVELLITVAIVVVLASIAIPEFSEYRRKAYDAEAVTTLHTYITWQETMTDGDDGDYRNGPEKDEKPPLLGLNWSSDVTLVGASQQLNTFCGYAYHSKGTPLYAYYFQTSSYYLNTAPTATISQQLLGTIEGSSNCLH